MVLLPGLGPTVRLRLPRLDLADSRHEGHPCFFTELSLGPGTAPAR